MHNIDIIKKYIGITDMSHFSTDIIADQAIDTVANMPMSKVTRMLLQRGKGTQFLAGPLQDQDKARDVLIDIVFQDLMDRPGPCG